MEALQRFIQAFLGLNVGMTVVVLAGDRGGGRFALTLAALVLAITAAPYLGVVAAMRRLSPRWAVAVGTAASLFGAADAALRMQALYFPTSTSDGAIAIWLPVSSLIAIPALAVVSYGGLAALDRARR